MKILVLGGGASGLACAINLKRQGHDVIIIEKNKSLGKKILITGNGRCNYFNSDFSFEKYFTNDIDSLKEIINNKNKEKLLEFYNSLGIVPSIINGYYYPYSDQAITFNYALINTVKALNIKTILEAEVKKIEKKDKFTVYYNDKKIESDQIVISMGSKCYPKTGSTGDSYKFIKEFGHKIEKPYPALVALKTNDMITKQCTGVRCSIRNELLVNDKKIYSDQGKLQINNDSISGICILNISGLAVKHLLAKDKVSVKINFLHDLNINHENFNSFLDNLSKKTDKNKVYDLLEGILNYKLVDYFFKKAKIDKDVDYSNITKKELDILNRLITEYIIDINSYKDFDNAQTSGGGVPLNEVNLKTMESKIVKGLYIIGETLEPYGICGGYNLSFSFLTGLLVGSELKK